MAKVSGTPRDRDKRYTDPEENPIHDCFGCEECSEDIDMMRANGDD